MAVRTLDGDDFRDLCASSAVRNNISLSPDKLVLQNPENARHYFLIRTMDRPRRLRILIESILAEVHNHDFSDVKVIVFDSSDIDTREINSKYLSSLTNKRLTCFHEFTSEDAISDGILTLHANVDTTQSNLVIPKDKSFGQASNYLSLLGLLHSSADAHNGYEPVFHFFDDDMSIHDWKTSKGSCGLEVTRPTPSKESFIQNAVESLQKTPTTYAMVGGIKDLYHIGCISYAYPLLTDHLRIIHQHLRDNTPASGEQLQNSIRLCTTLIQQLMHGRLPLFSEFCYSENRRNDNYYGCSAQQNPLGLSVTRGALSLMPFLLEHGNEDLIWKASLLALDIKHSYHAGRLFNWFGEHQKPLTMPDTLSSNVGIGSETLTRTHNDANTLKEAAENLLSFINKSLPEEAKTKYLVRLTTLLTDYFLSPMSKIATYASVDTKPSAEAITCWHEIASTLTHPQRV